MKNINLSMCGFRSKTFTVNNSFLSLWILEVFYKIIFLKVFDIFLLDLIRTHIHLGICCKFLIPYCKFALRVWALGFWFCGIFFFFFGLTAELLEQLTVFRDSWEFLCLAIIRKYISKDFCKRKVRGYFVFAL